MNRRRERDLKAELESHLALHIADGVRAGLTPEEARRQALIKLGGLDQATEACRAQRGWPVLDALARDVRYAARRLRQAPGAAVVVVLTQALGIGATSAIFSLVYAALLRPLPFPQASRLTWVSASITRRQATDLVAVSPDQVTSWRPGLERLFTSYAWVSRGGDGDIYRVNGVAMSPNVRSAGGGLFSLLGVRPLLGRLLQPADAAAGEVHVAVLSYRFWKQAYGGDPHVVGRTIVPQFGMAPITVVGVLPPGFHLEQPTGIWVPAVPEAQRTAYRSYYLLGRRRAGVSIAAVQTGIQTLARRDPAHSDASPPLVLTMQATSLREVLARGWRRPLLLLLAAVACLLLLACINVATIMLARARRRQPELALRLALGCSRRRLLQQLLVESGLLALAGGVVGWLCAAAGLRLLTVAGASLLPPAALSNFAMLGARGLNPAVVGFTLLLTCATLAGFGLLPALRAARWGLPGRIAGASRIGRGAQALVAAEVALAMVLVVGAGLLAHSFANLASTSPGFDTQGRITVDVEMPILICTQRPCTPETRTTTPYLGRLLLRLRALPGVTAAAGIGHLPLTTDFGPAPARAQDVFPSIVTDGYFATMGIPLLRGRDFDADDQPGKPKSLIVNQAFVGTFFPGQDVIGRKVPIVRCGKHFNPDPAGCTIVGVVGNVRQQALDVPPRPAAYVAFGQDGMLDLSFVLRTRQSFAGVLPEVRHLLHTLPPVAAGQRPFVFTPQSLDETVSLSIAAPRFRTWLTGLLAVLALLLAVVGIYGVESHAVSRRLHDIGVRMALGASAGDVQRAVLREALVWTLAGAAVGLPAGLALAHLLAAFLYKVPVWDPLTMAAAPLLLIAAALLAAWVPARRAMRCDPLAVLRSE